MAGSSRGVRGQQRARPPTEITAAELAPAFESGARRAREASRETAYGWRQGPRRVAGRAVEPSAADLRQERSASIGGQHPSREPPAPPQRRERDVPPPRRRCPGATLRSDQTGGSQSRRRREESGCCHEFSISQKHIRSHTQVGFKRDRGTCLQLKTPNHPLTPHLTKCFPEYHPSIALSWFLRVKVQQGKPLLSIEGNRDQHPRWCKTVYEPLLARSLKHPQPQDMGINRRCEIFHHLSKPMAQTTHRVPARGDSAQVRA